jgi:hypothetical protein
MDAKNKYLYIRTHASYDIYDTCKMGITSNIPERDTQYATSEIKRGCFYPVFEVPFEQGEDIEHLLQNIFQELNIRYDAGIEFYNKKIISLIEPCFASIGIKYRKLTERDINDLLKCDRDSRLSKEPETVYGKRFRWLEYLSVKRTYYDLETCKNKVNEYLALYPEMKKNYLDLSSICEELRELDNGFPPCGLWVEYYNINDLRDIITITNKKRTSGAIL